MKIAVLGGRFDPPHLSHFMIASQILEIRADIDKILLVPAYKHNWKPTIATAKVRLEMLKSLTADRIEISDIEIRRGGTSYTIDTIKSLKQATNAEIFWVIGSDIVPEFYKWEKPKELVKEATFLVFPRDPYELPHKLPEGFELVESEDLLVTNISSSAIRDRVKNKKSIKYLVPEDVDEYILKNNLYV